MQILTAVILALFAAVAIAVSIAIVVRRRRADAPAPPVVERALLWGLSVGCLLLLGHRAMFVHEQWAPLASHLDGLLLMCGLLVPLSALLVRFGRLHGLLDLTAPLLTLLLLWAICASLWTFQQFVTDTMFRAGHLVAVYFGALAVGVAGVAGSLYLLAEHRIRHPRHADAAAGLGRLAPLEAIETWMVRSAGIGFALLTVAMVTGLVIATAAPTRLGDTWWASPKFILATLVWAIFAVLMNLRFSSEFRGVRAAWLSLAGVVLMLTTFGLVTAWPASDAAAPADAPPAAQAPPAGDTPRLPDEGGT